MKDNVYVATHRHTGKRGEAVRTMVFNRGGVHIALDFNKDREVVGVEVLNAKMVEIDGKIVLEPNWAVDVQEGRDMHASPFTEAVCKHGVGHHKGTHGCDGCCAHCPKDIWKKVSRD